MDAAEHGVTMSDAMAVLSELIEYEHVMRDEKCANERAGCLAARDPVSVTKHTAFPARFSARF
jgi:hypothetical protein